MDSFASIKLGKPVYSRSLGFIVTQKRKVFGGLRHADTRKERQQRPEKFAELEPGQLPDDFRVPAREPARSAWSAPRWI